MKSPKVAPPVESLFGGETFFPRADRSAGLRILVVDDDPAYCKGLCLQLQSLGYAVFKLLDADAVLDVLDAFRPDAMILDVNLGKDYDGFELCRKIKARDETRGLPIIMASAVSVGRDAEDRGKRLGAAAFVIKPGTRFEIEGALDKIAGELAPKKSSAQSGKILVVDDDQEWLDLVRHWLEDAGHEVVASRTAGDLVALVRGEEPDCVVLDFDLKDRPADALCRELRQHEDLRRVHVIGHTAHPAAKVRMLTQGADQVLEKSAKPHELLALVAACLRRRDWESAVRAQDDVRLDASARKVEWKGKGYQLPDEQFRFFAALVGQSNRWVATERISRELQKGERMSEKALIQLAFRLRKALPKLLGRRVRYSKKLGWIYQTE